MNKLKIIRTTFMHMKNCTYLIYNTDNNQAVVVDPSWQLEKYEQCIRDKDLTLAAVLVTHHHMDHSNLAGQMASMHKCPVYMTKAEVDYYKFSCANLQPILAGKTTLNIAGIKVQVIPTPGHTFGGACYLIEDMLFCGDTLFMEGCGMCDIPGGDPIQMYNSLQELIAIVPDQVLVYPGHQYHFEIGNTFKHVKSSNVYLNFRSVEEFVKYRMRKGQKGLLDFT